MSYGASPEEWLHFDLGLGLTKDLLPVVSDPTAQISPLSKMKQLGKTPSCFNRQGNAVGLPKWTETVSRSKDIERWMKDDRLGLCIQTRRIRALDIDVDHEEAVEIANAFIARLGTFSPIPARARIGSSKMLLAFELLGEFPKRSFKTAHGLVEFLGNGQQFVAAGTHVSGLRYEWLGNLPDMFPFVSADAFEAAWQAIVDRFAIEAPHESRGARARSEALDVDDPVAAHIVEAGLDLGGDDEKVFVTCPWKDGHSMDSGDSETAWLIAGSRGYERGHFECRHASCAHRSDDDFLEAIGIGASSDFEVLETPDAPVDAAKAKLASVSLPFARDKSGRIEATVNNVMTALESPEWFGAEIALDEFRDEVIFTPHGKDQWRPINDTDFTLMRRRMEQRGFKPVGPEITRSSVHAVARKRRFDSAKRWLDGLEWDGKERVNDFLAHCFRAEPGPYASAVSRYWWTAHAARVMFPGCRADMVPILVSPEGRYKSSALALMVPHLDQFIEIDLEHKDADLSRKMRGALLGELAELRGLSGRSAEANKAWVSRRFEEWTPKYVETKHRIMRRVVLAGTTNEDDFLDDNTGERRWLPICVKEADRSCIAQNRDQLWAEAREIVRERMKDPLRTEEDAPAWEDAFLLGNEARSQFKREDGWRPAVARWALSWGTEVRAAGGEDVIYCTLERVFIEALGLSPTKYRKSDEQRLGKVLRTLGFTRKRLQVHGDRAWVWAPDALTCPFFGES